MVGIVGRNPPPANEHSFCDPSANDTARYLHSVLPLAAEAEDLSAGRNPSDSGSMARDLFGFGASGTGAAGSASFLGVDRRARAYPGAASNESSVSTVWAFATEADARRAAAAVAGATDSGAETGRIGAIRDQLLNGSTLLEPALDHSGAVRLQLTVMTRPDPAIDQPVTPAEAQSVEGVMRTSEGHLLDSTGSIVPVTNPGGFIHVRATKFGDGAAEQSMGVPDFNVETDLSLHEGVIPASMSHLHAADTFFGENKEHFLMEGRPQVGELNGLFRASATGGDTPVRVHTLPNGTVTSRIVWRGRAFIGV